ncbi:hypothetical protein Tco_0294968 [Tanacetum coccineum]
MPNVGDQSEMPNLGDQTKIPNVGEQSEIPNVSKQSDGSEESEDSEFDVDLENTIDDVDMGMDDFRKHIDEYVEWVGCNEVPVKDNQPIQDEVVEDVDLEDFENASDSDDIESNRKNALRKLVPSCYVIFDLSPLSLSFDFVFDSKIFKSFPSLSLSFCHLVILCLDRHAHTLYHLESLLTISLNNLCLDNLDIFKKDLEYQSLRNEFNSAGMELQHHCRFNKNLLDRVLAQSIGSSNTDVLDSPCLLVLNTGTSQSRQHDMSESNSYYLSD